MLRGALAPGRHRLAVAWRSGPAASRVPVLCTARQAATSAGDVTSQPPLQPYAELQVQAFSQPECVEQFTKPLPSDVDQRLAEIVSMLPGLGPSSRVLDVGAGTGCLLPHLLSAGAADVLAVDLSAPMLTALAARFPPPSSCGNDPGVRTWLGDFMALPAYMGPATAITMNGVFGNLPDPRAALLKATTLLPPGGHVLLSHPMGRAWHAALRQQTPELVPHPLPDEDQLRTLIADLPLRLLALRDEPDLYAALLQVPEGFALPGEPLVLEAPVVTGFGRGSRQLGVPTANLDVALLPADVLAALPRGVFFGWAQLDPPPGWPAEDGCVHKMVMNVGRRPTVNEGDEAMTVEVHVLHKFAGGEEFYGNNMRVVACGYLRPEQRFPGLPALLNRIRTDIGLARVALDAPSGAALRSHPSFVQR